MARNHASILQFYDTYNLRKTAIASKQTSSNTSAIRKELAATNLTSEKILESNREIANAARKSLELQKRSEEIQRHGVRLAGEQIKMLGMIDSNLSKIESSLQAMNKTLQHGFATLERQLDAQTNIMRDQLQTQKTESVLKEILYNMQKFQAQAKKSGDPLEIGLGARLLLNIISQHKFGTNNLNSIADKEYFDRVKTTAEEDLKSLSKGQLEDVENLETLYFLHRELINYDIKSLAENTFPLKPLEEPKKLSIPARPQKRHPKPTGLLLQLPNVIADKAGALHAIRLNRFFSHSIWITVVLFIVFGFVY